MHLANFKSDPSALLCANAAGTPPQPAQPLAYLHRCIAAAAAAAAAAAVAILLCFRLLTSVTTDYS